ncbi:MAG: hypothetical protein H0T79_14285 [Deltaproteobacteria bacterium]|nr:hypothetical protein [Deltaproteobacteria bacterium]
MVAVAIVLARRIDPPVVPPSIADPIDAAAVDAPQPVDALDEPGILEEPPPDTGPALPPPDASAPPRSIDAAPLVAAASPEPPPPVTPALAEPVDDEDTVPPLPPPSPTSLAWMMIPIASLGGAILALALVLVVRGFRRRRTFVAGPWRYQLRVPPARRDVLPRLAIDDGAADLTWQSSEEEGELDLDRTVAATVASGGLPQFLHKRQVAAPHYVVLQDRAGGARRWSFVYDELLRGLAREGVELERYTFDADATVCTARDGREVGLRDLLEHADALIVIGDGAAAVDAISGERAEWVTTLRQVPRRLWINPLPPSRWTAGARAIEAETPMEHGAARIVGTLRAGVERRERSARAYPAVIERAPTSASAIAALRGYLGRKAFRVVCAVAVLDVPTVANARWISEQLELALDEQDWLHLVALPWFATERWPEGLRTRLVHELVSDAPELVRRVQHAADRVLVASEPAAGSAAHLAWELDLATRFAERGERRVAARYLNALSTTTLGVDARRRLGALGVPDRRRHGLVAAFALGVTLVTGGVTALLVMRASERATLEAYLHQPHLARLSEDVILEPDVPPQFAVRVADATGQPLAGERVVFTSGEHTYATTSGADGVATVTSSETSGFGFVIARLFTAHEDAGGRAIKGERVVFRYDHRGKPDVVEVVQELVDSGFTIDPRIRRSTARILGTTIAGQLELTVGLGREQGGKPGMWVLVGPNVPPAPIVQCAPRSCMARLATEVGAVKTVTVLLDPAFILGTRVVPEADAAALREGVAGAMLGRILKVEVLGDDTIISVGVGSNSGVTRGSQGVLLIGDTDRPLADVTIIRVERRVTFAKARLSLDVLRANSRVRFTAEATSPSPPAPAPPPPMCPDLDNPKCPWPAPVLARILKTDVTGDGRVVVSIGAGALQGVSTRWVGRLVEHDVGEIKLIRVDSSVATGVLYATLEQVRESSTVKLSPLRSITPPRVPPGPMVGSAALEAAIKHRRAAIDACYQPTRGLRRTATVNATISGGQLNTIEVRGLAQSPGDPGAEVEQCITRLLTGIAVDVPKDLPLSATATITFANTPPGGGAAPGAVRGIAVSASGRDRATDKLGPTLLIAITKAISEVPSFRHVESGGDAKLLGDVAALEVGDRQVKCTIKIAVQNSSMALTMFVEGSGVVPLDATTTVADATTQCLGAVADDLVKKKLRRALEKAFPAKLPTAD